jgi:tetratricopeptide (TPR) repeat protein
VSTNALMRQAVEAMRGNRDDEAIRCLQRAIGLEPTNGSLHHLLGAVYAQLGKIDAAIAAMTQAITHAPQLDIARFQLGLLHFTCANVPAAQEVWQPLALLPAQHPLYLFRLGLLHLARDEFAACAEKLKRGIELNTAHPALNNNMRLVLDRAEQAMSSRA